MTERKAFRNGGKAHGRVRGAGRRRSPTEPVTGHEERLAEGNLGRVTEIRRHDAGRETEFEKRRGVNRLEVRNGFAQVHVTDLAGDLMRSRLGVLQAVADAGISLDFLKLSPSGMSFLVPEDRAEDVGAALRGCSAQHEIRTPRSILLVHAVNIRDEEGMIADIVQTLIATGAPVDHLGDMHDRILMVLRTDDVDRVAEQFRRRLMEDGV